MNKSGLAASVIPHLPQHLSNALGVFLDYADFRTSGEPVPSPSLPVGSAARFRKMTAATAKVAAYSAEDASDFDVLVKDSRVTVLRALATNPRLPLHTAKRLCEKAYKAGDTELLEAVIWRVHAKDLLKIRTSTAARQDPLRNFTLDFVLHVAHRNDPEEVSAVLADNDSSLAAIMLGFVADGSVACVNLNYAIGLLKDPASSFSESQKHVQRVSKEYAYNLVKHDVVDLTSSYATSYRTPELPVLNSDFPNYQSWPVLDAGVPQVLATSIENSLIAASLAQNPVHPSDVPFVIQCVTDRLATQLDQRNQSDRRFNVLDTCVELNAPVMDEATQMVAIRGYKALEESSTASRYSSWSYDNCAESLMPFASTAVRVELLPKCSAQLLATWLSNTWSHYMRSNELRAPRPEEAQTVLSGLTYDARKLVAHRLGHYAVFSEKENLESYPAWWEETVDALHDAFFETKSTAFTRYTTLRLAKAIGDDTQAWQMMANTWPEFYGKLSELVSLAELSMEYPVETPSQMDEQHTLF